MKLNPEDRIISEDAIKVLIGKFDDIGREGLKDTPRRYIKMMEELCTAQQFDFTTFDSDGYDEMIVEKGIPFFSLCEHHLVPFFGHVDIGYIPDKRIVGISKLARTVEMFARRFQVQERMTRQIADLLNEKLEPKGVAVVIRARHLCQEMRGVKKQDVQTVTSAVIGVINSNASARKEFFDLCLKGQ